MAVTAAVELDHVVALAVVLPDFDRDLDESPDDDFPVWHERVESFFLKASAVALLGVIGLVVGMVTGDRGTVAAPEVTVTAEAVVGVPFQADPIHGVIPEGRVVVGADIAPGSYLAVVASDSDVCSWYLVERPNDTRWERTRGQNSNRTASVDLQPGQVFETSGCNWRFR